MEKNKERGILKLEPRPRITIDTKCELTPQGSCDRPPSSPQPSVDRLSVTWAEPDPISMASGVNLFHLPSETPISNEVKFSPSAGADGSDDEDYSASLSAVLRQRRASVRRSRKGRARRASSPLLPDETRSRRRSSVFTTSSGDTAISMEDAQTGVVTQEQIFENIHLHKEVLGSVKQQPLGMRRKLKIVYQAKAYIKRHEGQLQERLAQSKSTRDIYARFNILLATKWQQLKREAANTSNLLIPWELRIKEIESHFGSVVASYFTFLRWLFWVNLVIGFILLVFVIVPEYLTANPDQDGERKIIMPEEQQNASNLLTLWEFEGVLKISPIFYGYYSNIERPEYRMPLAYFLTGLVVYIYSFVAILRKMAENSRMSKLSEKEDECIFSWKLFTGWDFMIGNAETAHNRIASVILGFKEALLEEAEKKKDLRNWRIISLRALVNICVVILLAVSAYAVITVVSRSDDNTKVRSWWRENETTVVVTVITITFPVFFEVLGLLEHYHPRKQLRLQLARIMLLNLLNLYSLIFALFSKIEGMSKDLDILKPNITMNATGIPESALNIGESLAMACFETSISCAPCIAPLTILTNMTAIQPSMASANKSLHKNISMISTTSAEIAQTLTGLPTKQTLNSERIFTPQNLIENEEETTDSDIDIAIDINRKKIDELIAKFPSPTSAFETSSETGDSEEINFYYDSDLPTDYTDIYTSSELSTENDFTESTISSSDSEITSLDNPYSSSILPFDYTSNFHVTNSYANLTPDFVSGSSTSMITDDISTNNQSSVTSNMYSEDGLSSLINFDFTTLTSFDNYTQPYSTDVDSIDSATTATSSTTKLTASTPMLRDPINNINRYLTAVTTISPISSSNMCPNITFNCTANCGGQNVTQVFTITNCSKVEQKCFVKQCQLAKFQGNTTRIDFVYEDGHKRKMYNLTADTKKKLLKLCWETMFGQELVKLTMMDLVFVLLGTLFMDFFRALFVRYMNRCWCWDLEKRFPSYGDFKIAENILHLINNQGMVWMGMFFSPGLVVLNVSKLMIMMYLRSWAVMTCNVPHEVVFRVSKSNNFYLALLLTMLFLCVLPVGYTIVCVKPSWHCGPFSEYERIYHILTSNIYKILPKSLNFALEYIASPAIVIPLLVLLILIIYYLTSLTNSLREANNDLKIQLRRERTEERRKMFQLADTRRRAGSSALDNTPFARWKKALPALPLGKSIDSDDRKTATNAENSEPTKIIKKKGGIFAKIVGLALDKKSDEGASEGDKDNCHSSNVDDETDTDFHETLPKEVLKLKDITIIKRSDPKKRSNVEFKNDSNKEEVTVEVNLETKDDLENKPKNYEQVNTNDKEDVSKTTHKQIGEKQTSECSVQSKQDSIGSIIPVITISTTESDDEMVNSKDSTKKDDKSKNKKQQENDTAKEKRSQNNSKPKSSDFKSLRRQSSVDSASDHKPVKRKKSEDGQKFQHSL